MWVVVSRATNVPSGSSLRRHCPETPWGWWTATRYILFGVKLPEAERLRVTRACMRGCQAPIRWRRYVGHLARAMVVYAPSCRLRRAGLRSSPCEAMADERLEPRVKTLWGLQEGEMPGLLPDL